MHLCENCHQFVDDGSQYCANCGTVQKVMNISRDPDNPKPSAQPQTLPPPYPVVTQPGPSFQQENRKTRNRGISAGLNFFIPGAGYIYNGAGRDKTQIIFGIIVLLAFFIGFYIPIIGSLSSVSAASSSVPVSTPPIQVLEVLIFILPIGLAYDAYQRAS